jgi:polar amino acid transport system substrate-binding protein
VTVLVAFAAAVALVACSSTSSGTPATLPPLGLSSTTTTAPSGPTTTTPVVSCGNPVASIAPTSPLPTPGGTMPAGSDMATIKKRGRLIAGVSADTLLFSYRNPLTGNIEGFDVDMVRQVAQAIFGNPDKVQYKIETYAQRIPDLLSGAVDIVADVMTINCSRWQQIDFSSQYYEAGQKVLVSTASKAKSIDDLDGQRVCAAEGSTNIQELANYPKVKVVPVPDVSDCMVLFQEGTVDAVTGDDTVLAGFVAQDPYAKMVGPDFTSEPYGLGIAKTHPDFVRFVNSVLAGMRTNGTWKQLYVKWLKPTGAVPNPPPAVYGRSAT